MQALTFTIDARRYAIPLANVAEVVPAVNVHDLPNAPSIVEGAVNVRGEILPVLALRAKLGHESRPVGPTEYFILVRARARRAIVRSDSTPLIASLPDAVETGDEPVGRAIAGVIPLQDGLALFHDLDAFIDAVDDGVLTAALATALVTT